MSLHARQSASLDLWDALEGPVGYSTALRLTDDETARVKALIEQQWLAQIRTAAPDAAESFAAAGIEHYHELAHLVDHGSLWPKRNRILPADAVAEVRGMSLVAQLSEQFGEFTISSEDGSGWEELYWRLVRPGQPGDVGPVHADAWFWELGHGETPAGVRRVKVWLAVATEPGRNGLRVVPGSHLREWRYHGEHRHGFVKPVIDEDERDLDLHLVPTQPGEAIVFHDRLLHGGAVNQGRTTRVSLEFTMFVKPPAAGAGP